MASTVWIRRGARFGGIALTALLLWGARVSERHLESAPVRGADGPPPGASAELARARREQALFRAEGTARMLRALLAAPTLPGVGP